MLKISYLLFIVALLGGISLNAEEVDNIEKVDSTESPASAEETSTVEPAAEIAESIPESELIEMVGFLTAQGGGIPMLKLSDAEVVTLTNGLVDGLNGVKTFEDFPEESIRGAYGQAQRRVEAIEAESEEISGIEDDALRIIGFVTAMQSGLIQLGFKGEEVTFIKKGFVSGANAMEPDPADKAKLPAFQEFIQKRAEAAQEKAEAEMKALAAERTVASKGFFEKLEADTAVQKSDSGLYYRILKPGAETKPTLEDSVLVHYKGTLIDGSKFDSSYDRGQPAKFPLKGVVKGFGEGLTKIGAGGKIILYIPSELGYGDNPRPGGPIKPGDTLIFECELIEVNP